MSSSSPASTLEVDLEPGRPPILTVDAAHDPLGWTTEHRDELRAAIAEHGSVLLRGLGLGAPADLGVIAERLTSGPFVEKEAFAAREVHPGGVYSSSAWPPNQQMCMHHEMSYRLEFPAVMMFGCLVAPTDGGEIALADAAEVLTALPPDLVERFETGGWTLIRNYTDEIGLSVEEAFGTDDRAAVEGYCQANSIDFEWRPDGSLRTRQHRPAVVDHPVSGRKCWFNQIAFLNEWTMNPEVHDFLVDMYGADGLPFNTAFGNGEPIDADVVAVVNEVYEANAAREPLQAGDLIVVDNIRTAHSRDPFEGPREVVVAMGEGVHLADLVSGSS